LEPADLTIREWVATEFSAALTTKIRTGLEAIARGRSPLTRLGLK
jgi:hypothetical protein